jgi:gamma-butyrobetaine dioxygenase
MILTGSAVWLRHNCPCPDCRDPAPPEPDPRTEDAKRLWRAADLDGRLPAAGWDAYRSDDAVRIGCLEAVLRYGFVLLRGVPAAPGTVESVAATFGYVRETNYGRVFDVRVEHAPANAAPAGLLRRPGRPAQHPGGVAPRSGQ